MNILVTGGTGFIGTQLVDELLREGHSVRLIGRRQRTDLKPTWRDEVDYVQANFFGETNFEACTKGIDVVYHLLWTSLPRSSPEFSVHYLEANVGYSLRLLDACVANKVKKVVFTSSGGTVYGITDHYPIKEEAALQPITNYGITKVTFEQYLALYHYQYGIDYAVARIANAYGEHQNPFKKQGVVAAWLYSIINEEPIEVWGDGSVVRDYLYNQDLTEALIKMAATGLPEKVFNVGSGVGLSLNQVLDTLRKVTDATPEVRYLRQHKDDVPFNILEIQRLSDTLDWQPRTSFEQGIRFMYDAFKTRYARSTNDLS
ncbi:MAG: NAD-dependent epimerase/dehydratase family protein [Catalinimonas sp.]